MKWRAQPDNKHKVLQDSDKMPWGKHEGVPMTQIPAEYFHFLWHEKGFKDKTDDNVANYIRKVLPALKTENKDLLWG